MGNKGYERNRYYFTRDSYRIDPAYLPGVQLGSGIDMSDPRQPRLRHEWPWATRFRSPAAESQLGGPPMGKDSIVSSFRFVEGKGVEQQASILSSYFKASYMLSSVNAAVESVNTDLSGYHTIYALLEQSGATETFPSDLRHWTKAPDSELIEDEEEALVHFLRNYGSHYVSVITYGLRIGIQGKLEETSSVTKTAVAGAFEAAFGQFGAEGGASYEDMQKLSEWDVSLTLEVTSGGRTDGRQTIARNMDQIVKLLDDLETGEVQFLVAPIELSLASHWEKLDLQWEKTRDLLKPSKGFEVPGAQFGVPPGTILAWHPTAEYVKGLDADSEEKVIEPPPGWAICNGEHGTPDLTDRFIMGTEKWKDVGQVGGTTEHAHGATRDPEAKDWGVVWATRTVAIAAQEKETHIPPNVKVVYIMKLA
jgi:hypothetical protein